MRRLCQIAYFLTIAVLLLACGGTKKIVQVIPEVEWAKNRPRLQSYYVGIGQTNKIGAPNDYMQTAKQNALADMASDISVNISSNSVISAFETQNIFFEDYSQNVKTETQKELDGYELVDTYEDDTQYWVYYRLSKAHYQKTAEKKKADAGLKAVDYYSKALQNIDNGDLRTGIVMLIKALEPIRNYFSETISVQFNGQEIYIGNEIIQKFTETVNSLTVTGPMTVEAKLGKGVDQESLTYYVQSSNGLPQRGFQVKATYSEKSIAKNKAITGNEGEVRFSIDAIRTNKVQEQLTATIDLDNLIKEGTSESILRKMLSKVTTPSFTTSINVIKPSVYVGQIDSKYEGVLLQAASRKLSASGIPIVDNKGQADYSVSVTSSLSQPVMNGNYNVVTLTATVVVKNSNGMEVYRKNLDKIKGSHFDANQARTSAYNDAAKRIENTVVREIVEGVIKGKKVF